MKNLSVILASTLAFASASFAQTTSGTATTDPVGYVTYNCLGNSDTYVTVPFTRAPEYVGVVSAISEGAGAAVITLSGTPGFTTNQFVFVPRTTQTVPSTQPKTYYVLVGGTSGGRAGMFYTITANTTNSLTIDLTGDTLASSITTGSTSIKVIPYATLDSIFPGGQGINGSPSHSAGTRQTEILIPDQATAGTDLAASRSYYYYSGTNSPGTGWRQAGITSQIKNDDVLPPDSYFIVRQDVATTTTLTLLGNVHMGTFRCPVSTLQANIDQDVPVGLLLAADTTLGNSNLFQSGAFAGSTSHSAAVRQDQILVFDNSVVGKDKAAAASYYYYTGTNTPGAGWRKAGVTSSLADSTLIFGSQNTAVLFRKKGTATAQSVLWPITPSYAQ